MQRHEPKKTVGEVMRENAELSTSQALPHCVFAYTPIGKFIWFIVFAISLGNYRVIINAYYRPQRSSGKVMFSQACVKNSVHKGGGCLPLPPPRALWDSVNKWVVRILLECIFCLNVNLIKT